MDLLNLEKQFAFYGAYHRNQINVLIHMVFVWPILFSGFMLGYYLPMLLFPNVGLFSTFIFATFFVILDRKAGSFAALLCFLCWFAASSLAIRLGFSFTWKVVLAAQLFCWTAQFIGHGVFEKRKPALLDSLLQAYLMAPFFVLLEALEMTVGYEPYPGFHAKVEVMVEANIKEWKLKQQRKHKNK